MQGDPKVDELMRPVLAAIKRHMKDRDAITDIYNRAYEVVMNSMDAKSGKTYCAYCGAEYPLDDSAATLVSEHIKTCNKHPMRVIEAALAAANEDAERLAKMCEESECCRPHQEWMFMLTPDDSHAADCPITLHRARVGGEK